MDKLVEECSENGYESKLTEIAISENENSYKSQCIFCYFGYFLQLTLVGEVLILFIFLDT